MSHYDECKFRKKRKLKKEYLVEYFKEILPEARRSKSELKIVKRNINHKKVVPSYNINSDSENYNLNKKNNNDFLYFNVNRNNTLNTNIYNYETNEETDGIYSKIKFTQRNSISVNNKYFTRDKNKFQRKDLIPEKEEKKETFICLPKNYVLDKRFNKRKEIVIRIYESDEESEKNNDKSYNIKEEVSDIIEISDSEENEVNSFTNKKRYYEHQSMPRIKKKSYPRYNFKYLGKKRNENKMRKSHRIPINKRYKENFNFDEFDFYKLTKKLYKKRKNKKIYFF